MDLVLMMLFVNFSCRLRYFNFPLADIRRKYKYNLSVTQKTNIFLPVKVREYVFTGVGLYVGLSISLSVTTITKKTVDGFVPNFMRRFLGGKGRPSSCFITISRGMWK